MINRKKTKEALGLLFYGTALEPIWKIHYMYPLFYYFYTN